MAGPQKDEKEKLAPIVIKRIKKGGGGHHGGAWKVAYADFVTAMMAFFLLLWLLNVTTKEQKNAISNYFDPTHPKVSSSESGAGGIMGGMTMSPVGAMSSDVQPLVQTPEQAVSTHGKLSGDTTPEEQAEAAEIAKLEEELREKENKRFEAAAEQLKAEIAKSPELKDLQNNILIDITPEGLRIQIVDDKGRSMFPSGSAVMYDFMTKILTKISGVITALPNQVSVRGHTDSAKYRVPNTYDNWNLSADRAQASRRVIIASGLPEGRIENVMGRSDREPLEKDPASARNRRISIILMREKPSKETLEKMKAQNAAASEAKKAADAKTNPPVVIVDDTIQGPPTPQPGTVKPGQQTPRAEYVQPQRNTPLPVTPSTDNFQRQPQVLQFDSTPAAPNAPLYEGPVIAPIQNKPPRITTPVFKLESEKPVEQKSVTPSTTPAQKTITFGDDVPAQAPPIRRPAPAAPAPAATPQAAPIPAAPAPVAPIPAPAKGKELQF